MLETRLLKYFLAVAREQNITRAADSLHISQSTLSKQLMDLEASLGVQLLIRGKRSITLTDEGKYLRSRAQEAVGFLEQTEQDLKREEGAVGGEIRLGCAQMASMRDIDSMMASFQEKYPDVQFHLLSGDSDRVLEKLNAGMLDAGILLSPPIENQFEYYRLPMEESFGFLMNKNCSLAKKKTISSKDILDLPLIMPDEVYYGAARDQWFGDYYDRYKIISTYDLIGNAVYFAENNLGCIFALDHLVPTKGTNLVFVKAQPMITVDVTMITKKYQVFSPAAKLFLNELKASAQPIE
jgi:DNA-binding transcriptional LysR family regulator